MFRSPKFSVDAISFWIGFVAATAFWFMVRALRPLIAQIRGDWQKSREDAAMRNASGTEETHRQNVLKIAQGMHLAAPLFALDEIIITPKLVAPPPQIDPGEELVLQDQTNIAIPYTPQDSLLSSYYQTETISIPEALSGGSHLAILGDPGVGKSVALAYIASVAAKESPELGALTGAVPFLLHVADMELPYTEKSDVLAPLMPAITKNASLIWASRLPKFVHLMFNSGRALLLLDGLDELPQDQIQEIVEYLAYLLKAFPRIRVITAVSPEYIGKLGQIGFAALALRTWSGIDQQNFLEKWGDLWTNYVALETWVQAGPAQVDALLLNEWINIDSANLTPLELTLKTWGAYAGDGRGPSAMDAIETHLVRLSPTEAPIAALEMLAMQVSITAQPVFDSRKARAWIKSFEPPDETIMAEDTGNNPEEGDENKKEKVAVPTQNLLNKMAESGLLSTHRNYYMRFTHPIFGGYLAGRGLSGYNTDDRLIEQPNWSGRTLAMHYLAAKGDASKLVNTLLERPDPVTERNILMMGKWLRDAPRKSPWRGKVLTNLATTLQDDTLPLILRGQIITSLARSGDPSVAALFRQLLRTPSAYNIQLAALGSGLMQDKKATDSLTQTLASFQNAYTLTAVCLALSAIGTDSALEALATALLQGDESLRRGAAEALANHPQEGWPMLRDGIEMDDILVRRSVVYGLARIKEDWATELLSAIQVEDKEWAVRDIAKSILEKSDLPNPRIPRKLSPPSETPWLITFAGKQNMGISPGAPATDVLLLALKSEEPEESLAALRYLKRKPSEGVINALYHTMNGSSIEMREAIFLALVEIAASGVTLPNPRAYGLA
jgi:HEAT repeat protein